MINCKRLSLHEHEDCDNNIYVIRKSLSGKYLKAFVLESCIYILKLAFLLKVDFSSDKVQKFSDNYSTIAPQIYLYAVLFPLRKT